ncbi:hypothetical protein [Ornithinibacillus sp. FSL M8-0202]|uniref:hypothetical protein n=1 Tax=Ornithinibacillus sp. FSL M8-0202 TaxID=2921616 RepID=UPI0030D40165
MTYYHDEIKSDERAKRIIDAVNAKKNRVIPLVAEEFSPEKYVLLENFEYYSSLLKIRPYVRVPCLVYPKTSEVDRLIQILKVTIPLEKGTSWLFKNEHIMRLVDVHNMSIRNIANLTNCSISKINSYILNREIPIHIREVAIQAEAKTVLESICKSTVIPKPLKPILYEKAIIEKGSSHRLNIQKLQLLKHFCSVTEIPIFILDSRSLLKRLIDQLVSTNFNLSTHMINLLNKFIEEETAL